ncbi:hypothetical protein C0Q70_09670 [Pomacea canaliculata]|uniref:Uncharacterized protein n=1 Tax=Pomacea canaliculata TaxID=400727 RepID=A0A2T7PAF6_POMCA|nr:hypothetical protein C0Q70_09670 [Pomacea canaliculata]
MITCCPLDATGDKRLPLKADRWQPFEAEEDAKEGGYLLKYGGVANGRRDCRFDERMKWSEGSGLYTTTELTQQWTVHPVCTIPGAQCLRCPGVRVGWRDVYDHPRPEMLDGTCHLRAQLGSQAPPFVIPFCPMKDLLCVCVCAPHPRVSRVNSCGLSAMSKVTRPGVSRFTPES